MPKISQWSIKVTEFKVVHLPNTEFILNTLKNESKNQDKFSPAMLILLTRYNYQNCIWISIAFAIDSYFL